MSAPNPIVRHWSQLDGSVHPLDAHVFAGNTHSFNLDYPPPAFTGDINNAPVILLEANGGYDPGVTPTEFAAPDAIDRYLDSSETHVLCIRVRSHPIMAREITQT